MRNNPQISVEHSGLINLIIDSLDLSKKENQLLFFSSVKQGVESFVKDGIIRKRASLFYDPVTFEYVVQAYQKITGRALVD